MGCMKPMTSIPWRTSSVLAAALSLLVASHGAATEASATTTNTAPSVGGVYFYASDAAAASGATCPATGRVTSFTPSAGTTRAVYVCAEFADQNGYNDVCATGATRTFSVTNSASASISTAANPKSSVALSCATGSGTAVAATGAFNMEYWRPWASSGAANLYRVSVSVVDVAAASASAVGTYGYANLTAISAPASLALGGALAPAATGAEATANIYNNGNVAFSIQASGTALTGGSKSQTIAAGNLKWGAASGLYGAKTALTGSAVNTAVAAGVETSDTPTTRALYLQLAAPSGGSQWVPADTYSGTVTFTAG